MVIHDQRAIIITTVTTYNFYLIFVSKSGKSALSSIVIVNMYNNLVDNYLALRTIPSHIIKVSKKEMPESKCSKIIHFLSKFLLKIFRPINIINSEWQMTFTCCQKKTESTLHVRESRTGENFCLWNPESWALESGIQLKESRIPLNDWNPQRLESSTVFRNPRRGIQNPRLS